MKVLGISFGRKMKNSEIMVKEALFAAKAAGAEVEFISTIGMNIKHCVGCGACSRGRDNGKAIKCVIKDDYQTLVDKVLEADGVIIAAPVYILGIVGQFKNFVDRFGPAHDRAALLEENKRREKEGLPLLDPNTTKDRYVGYISVGGASTQNWVSFGLPNMNYFGISLNMKKVGHIDAYDQGRTASPVFDENLMKKVGDLGSAVANAIGKPYKEITEWVGDIGVCPVCHNNQITIKPDMSTDVECPSCGINGELKIVDGKVQVTFSEKEQARARGTVEGLYEHYYEIQGMKEIAIPKIVNNKEKLAELLEKYENFDEHIKR
jgi:multimeric flavodoxin WrbA